MAHSADHTAHGGDSHHFAHTVSPALLITVFVALLFFTFLTIRLNDFDLGFIEIWISMGIATIKAALVMSIFMHMLHDKKFNLLVFLSSFIFAALFIGFTLMDSQEYNEEVKEYDYTVIKNELELKK